MIEAFPGRTAFSPQNIFCFHELLFFGFFLLVGKAPAWGCPPVPFPLVFEPFGVTVAIRKEKERAPFPFVVPRKRK
jgi:hypothetical protein